ncbi:MAG: hypothetical protein PHV32_07215 [Eubacteriales bacterium]|nr:hypothetical protein [Eubacteriales bacterium]
MSRDFLRKLFKSIKPLKRRMHLNNAIYLLSVAFLSASGIGLIIAAAALITPIPFAEKTILTAASVIMAAGVPGALLSRPRSLKCLKMADSLGLKERLITAWQFRERKDSVYEVQRQDALNEAGRFDFKSHYPIKAPIREIVASIVIAVVTVSLLLTGSPARLQAKTIEEVIEENRKQAEHFEEIKEGLKDEKELTEEQKQALEEQLNKLIEQLREAKSEEDAIKALSKTNHQLEELYKEQKMQELSQLEQALRGNPSTEGLAEAIKNKDANNLEEALERLKEELAGMNMGERQELAELLEETAESLGEADKESQALSELAAAIENASGEISDEDSIRIQEAASNLSEAIQNAMASTSEGSGSAGANAGGAIGKLMKSLNGAKRSIAYSAGSSGRFTAQGEQGEGEGQGSGEGEGEGQGSGSGEGQGQGQGSGSGEGQGSGSGEGEGQGQGSGSGEGEGQGGGSGAGGGSTNTDGGQGGQDGTGNGSKPSGEGGVREFESIYVPERLGGDGTGSSIPGAPGEGGSSQWYEASDVPVEKGAVVSYDKVLQQYKQEAFYHIDSVNIPPMMKDLVREYFTSLE